MRVDPLVGEHTQTRGRLGRLNTGAPPLSPGRGAQGLESSCWGRETSSSCISEWACESTGKAARENQGGCAEPRKGRLDVSRAAEMGCPLLQNTKHTQAEPPLGSSDTVMSQLVMEQLNSAVKEPSGDPEPHSNKPEAGGSRSPWVTSSSGFGPDYQMGWPDRSRILHWDTCELSKIHWRVSANVGLGG